ncbi:MAG: tol-pal system protein YbgF [Deltaproteobacteria bacterium]|nr:tol-pal system protein YbgF [Deltaproteobacteria bacterium]
MTWKIHTFVIALVFTLTGCVEQKHEQLLMDMQNQLAELKRAQAEGNIKIGELNNKILLLQEKVEADKKTIEELKSMAIPTSPPPELKVVKLPAEGSREEGIKKERLPEPDELYQQAQDLYVAGRLEEAIAQFNRFIQNYPKHPLADNAQYWVGEAYYSRKEFQKAVPEFQKVVDNYPGENKTPDALLKIGFSYIELGDNERAGNTLTRLIKTYPSSEAAKKARAKLDELRR